MKNFKKAKITMLFLLIMYVVSMVVVISRNMYFSNSSKEKLNKAKEMIENTSRLEGIIEEDSITDEKEVEKDKDIFSKDGIIGKIIIPSLNIEAPICEGVGADILKYYVRTF